MPWAGTLTPILIGSRLPNPLAAPLKQCYNNLGTCSECAALLSASSCSVVIHKSSSDEVEPSMDWCGQFSYKALARGQGLGELQSQRVSTAERV